MEKKPHLLIVSALPLAAGGIEQHLLLLIRGAQAQYKITLLSPATPVFLGQLPGLNVQVQGWQVGGLWDVGAVFQLVRHLQKIKPDIIHIHDARAGFLCRPVIAFMRKPVAYTVHLPSYLYWRPGAFAKFVNLAYAAMEGLLNHLATDRVIYVGRLTLEDAVRRKITPMQKAVLIANGIDLQPFREAAIPQKTVKLRSLGKAPHGVPVVICVARLTVQKNIDLLLRVAARLKMQGFEFRLWLVGDGSDRGELEELAVSLGIRDLTQFWGTRSDIPDLLKAADLFVLLSRYEGGRTLSLMEAQAAGKPCIVSDVGDHRLMVHEGVHGFVIPPDDFDLALSKISEILLDADSISKMGHAAQKTAFDGYDARLMVESVLRIYSELLNGTV